MTKKNEPKKNPIYRFIETNSGKPSLKDKAVAIYEIAEKKIHLTLNKMDLNDKQIEGIAKGLEVFAAFMAYQSGSSFTVSSFLAFIGSVLMFIIGISITLSIYIIALIMRGK